MAVISIQERGPKGKEKITFSNFGGLLGIRSIWKHLGIEEILNDVGIKKRSGNSTSELAFLCISKPLVDANSEKELAHKTRLKDGDRLLSPRKVIQKNINRFLNSKSFNFKDLYLEVINRILLRGEVKTKHSDVLIIDDTPLHKTGETMEWAKTLFDSTKGIYYWGYQMVALALANGKNTFFLDFELRPPDKRKRRKKKRGRKKKGYRPPGPNPTKLTLALSMVKQALQGGVKARYVTFDSWYFALSFLRETTKFGLIFVGALKSNRSFIYDGKRKTAKYFIRIAKGEKRSRKFLVTLPNFGPVALAIIRKTSEGGKIRYDAVVTNDLKMDIDKIERIYSKRWSIETLFREAKQTFGLEKFHNQNLGAILANIIFSLLSMVLLRLFRLSHKLLRSNTIGFIKKHIIQTKVLIKMTVKGWEFTFYDDQLALPIFKGVSLCLESV